MAKRDDQSSSTAIRLPPAMGRKQAPDPLRASLILALGYAVVAIGYIQLSGLLVLAHSADAQELARMEALKGSLFIVITGILLFIGAFFSLRRFQVGEAELQRREEALLQAHSRALVGDVAAASAHDLANILAVSQGNLELARHKGEAAGAYLDHALAAHQQAAALLDCLRQRPREQQNSLEWVVTTTVALVHQHRALQACDLRVRWHGEAERTCVDALAVHRFLLNAIVNAGEASPQGHIIVECIRNQSGMHLLAVHDNGPGIPPHLHQQICEPYISTKDRGSGLGMLAAVVCARRLGGRLELGISEHLGGARVALSFPAPPSS